MVPRKCQPTLAYSASAIWGPNAFRLARAVQAIFGLLGKEQLLVIRRDRFQHCMLFFTTSSGNHSTGSQNLDAKGIMNPADASRALQLCNVLQTFPGSAVRLETFLSTRYKPPFHYPLHG